MDRFIGPRWLAFLDDIFAFKIQYGQIYRDREQEHTKNHKYLKSNMDRFIEQHNIFMNV